MIPMNGNILYSLLKKIYPVAVSGADIRPNFTLEYRVAA